MPSNIIPSTFQLVLEFIDFILVYLLTYRLLSWLKKSHAMNLIKGVFPIVETKSLYTLLTFMFFIFAYSIGFK